MRSIVVRSTSPGRRSERLASDLRRAVRGEVRFGRGARALYATDASNYRQLPVGVVLPRDPEDVVAALAVCRDHDAAVLPRGGGTSLAGQACNTAVVVDCSKHLTDVVAIDPGARTARVRPGVVLDRLQEAAAPFGLMFGPDPATHDRCTLGGMLGNNSCGVHSVLAGRTVDNVESLDVVLYDGAELSLRRIDAAERATRRDGGAREAALVRALEAIVERHAGRIRERYPAIPRRVSGYNLDELLPERGFDLARAVVGSEGTCVTVLEATLRLVPAPAGRALVAVGYPDAFAAADDVPDVLEAGPIGLEGFDARLLEYAGKKGLDRGRELLPDGAGWLLAELGGASAAEARERARELADRLAARGLAVRVLDDSVQAQRVWQIRESGLGATARVPGERDTWPGWEDAAVPPARLGDYLRDFRRLLDRYRYTAALYGHFGQACVHTRIDFDLVSADGVSAFRRFCEDAARLVVDYGGSLSGEHGDGQARAELLPLMYGRELVGAFADFKAAFDPDGRMNPGKVVAPARLDEHLRLGADYRPARPRTVFAFPADGGSLARAATRCVGVGRCRRESGGVMCPSYMVTRAEEHSTRGRARLLFELLAGELRDEGWRSEAVREALDLCLACKGCRSECPVNVDMASYKAEFLSHYYHGRLRPRSAYALGLFPWWARLASRAPALANAATGSRALAPVAKAAAGVAPQRELPRFARATFRAWFARRPPVNAGAPPVLLWPDTFTNHLQPRIAVAATEVLEDAGYRVVLPPRPLCCGRPLYDFGWLSPARRLLRRVLRELRPALDGGAPLVGLEPSCVAVFRDELVNLFPDDPEARRLHDRALTLAEFLAREGYEAAAPRGRRAVVQQHCHERSVLDAGAQARVLDRAGVEHELLDAGCCGMAGAFGFERAHYDVSVACAERALLPAVRALDAETLLVADGFSCREQVSQLAGRRALHLAEVLRPRP